jgi:hypothetical protein
LARCSFGGEEVGVGPFVPEWRSQSGGAIDLKALFSGFSYEVDTMEESLWDQAVSMFRDSSIYQTWAYESVRSERAVASRLAVRRGCEIVALSQARIIQSRLLGGGIAYIRWGPVWRLPARADEETVLAQALRAIHNEYVCRRRLLTRVEPAVFAEDSGPTLSILQGESFVPARRGPCGRTILIDLSPSLDDLRKGMAQKWRNRLNRAERNGLGVTESEDTEDFLRFEKLYHAMLRRKEFFTSTDIRHFLRMQARIPRVGRMRVFLALRDGEPCAGAICAAMGDKAVYLFGATNEVGMTNNGSYLVQWRILQWLKATGILCYDLHGINPKTNPGTYHFKAGLAGRNGRNVTFLGPFEACGSAASLLAVRGAEVGREIYRRARRFLTAS